MVADQSPLTIQRRAHPDSSSVCVYVCAFGGQKLTTEVVLQVMSISVFETGCQRSGSRCIWARLSEMSATTPGFFMRVPGLERRSSCLQGKHLTYWAIFPLVLFHMPSCYLTGRLSSSDCRLSSHGVEMSCSRIPYEGLCKP